VEEASGNGHTSCRVEARSVQPTRRALVVDDEPDIAGMLAEILSPIGYRCDLAATGSDAQHLLSYHDYDAILCDLRMPEMDGQALYGWLEENRPHLCQRTAFVTGDTLSQGVGNFLAHSGRLVLEKPFVAEEVRLLVAALAADEPCDR
jgi:CheY-like chemotaxis protein